MEEGIKGIAAGMISARSLASSHSSAYILFI